MFYKHGFLIFMYVLYHVHAVPVGPEEGTEFPEAGVTGSCKLPGGCWEADLAPLQELLS